MRKFYLTLILIVCSMVSIGQTFAQANYYEMGVIDTTLQDVRWGEKIKMEPALVSLNTRSLKIHTEKIQKYFFKSSKYELTEVEGYYYFSYNAEREPCIVYIYKGEDDLDYIEIEKGNYLIKYHLIGLE